MPYRIPLGYPFDPGAVGVKFFLLDMDFFCIFAVFSQSIKDKQPFVNQ